MEVTTSGQLALPSSSRALRDIVLTALDQPRPAPLGGNTGLPQGAVDCLDQNLVIAMTTVSERVFDDAITRYADRHRRDVLLIRHGFHPETLDPVRVDVALRSSCGGAVLVPDLSLWRCANGSLHLVPDRADLFVAVAPHGLDVVLIAPWDTLDERSDGLAVAAREVVRAVARARTE